jgi:transposase
MKHYTIRDFNRDFPNDDTCLEWLKNYLYPDGIFCKHCSEVTKHHRVSNRPCYACDNCGNHVYPMVGTIFEKSTTPLKLWFYAIYLISSTRCGISAKQLQRELGVTYKTAWRMFHQIRLLLDEKPNPMSGEVELDETYIGGKRQGKRGRGAEGKTPVFGIARKEGKVLAVSTPNLKSSTVFPIVKEHVLPESMIYTDEYSIYDGLRKQGYSHKRVHHASKVWTIGNAHTNTIEGFWSLLKRSINGVYHSVSEKYLQGYINEYSFRYNHRGDERPMFELILEKI